MCVSNTMGWVFVRIHVDHHYTPPEIDIAHDVMHCLFENGITSNPKWRITHALMPYKRTSYISIAVESMESYFVSYIVILNGDVVAGDPFPFECSTSFICSFAHFYFRFYLVYLFFVVVVCLSNECSNEKIPWSKLRKHLLFACLKNLLYTVCRHRHTQ